ncbi:hypothetical protein HNP55_004719 [Paucibacter oligotrophus]|uniref:ABC-type amino acid transport substrate-binding protein n=1 Tax=Roseateles oligotrophus TaxID=1769250 RepID=A0A840LGH1_9BURK|nr:transporter substrate-binding domain-containing protein [Roseateles oligotrophus]MBB4846165.1 hypothetical protein [Roseateles oligotrophus]
MRPLHRLLAAFLGLLMGVIFGTLPLHSPAWAQASAKRVSLVYPRPESERDTRNSYVLDLLRLALSKQSGTLYQLEPASTAMTQLRVLKELELGRGLDIAWSMTSAAREEALLPIRIPIDKGLLGLRVALVASDRPKVLASAQNLQSLQALVAGQGQDWPDTQILRNSGINVSGVGSYEALFRMLALHRFDYFPRSVLEVWQELDLQPQGQLVVDKHLLIHYPTALYFFVRKDRQALADVVQRGLEQALQDGSFDCLFERHFGQVLQRAELGSRTVIELPNTLLPAATPLERSELWYRTPGGKNKADKPGKTRLATSLAARACT